MDCFAFSLKPQEAMIERKYEITQRFTELLRSLVNAMLAEKPRIREVGERRPRVNPAGRAASKPEMEPGIAEAPVGWPGPVVTQITYCMNRPSHARNQSHDEIFCGRTS
jgi:hypothetical protein